MKILTQHYAPYEEKFWIKTACEEALQLMSACMWWGLQCTYIHIYDWRIIDVRLVTPTWEKRQNRESEISSASPNSSTSTVQREGVQTLFLILTFLLLKNLQQYIKKILFWLFQSMEQFCDSRFETLSFIVVGEYWGWEVVKSFTWD